jgi:hypothetical protein
MRTLCLALVLAIAGTAGRSAADIYRWVDESGHTRFSDRIEDVPPAWRKNVEQQIRSATAGDAMVERTVRTTPPAAPAARPEPAAPTKPAVPPAPSTSPFVGLPGLAGGAVGLVALVLALRRRRRMRLPG